MATTNFNQNKVSRMPKDSGWRRLKYRRDSVQQIGSLRAQCDQASNRQALRLLVTCSAQAIRPGPLWISAKNRPKTTRARRQSLSKMPQLPRRKPMKRMAQLVAGRTPRCWLDQAAGTRICRAENTETPATIFGVLHMMAPKELRRTPTTY